MSRLHVEGLSVRYGNISAVEDLSISVVAGEVVVLLGANGAGKTSALRGIMGLEPATGTTILDGRDLAKEPTFRRARSGLVLVPEGRRVFAPLTIEENLDMGGYRHRDGRHKQQVLAEVYEMFPILADRRRIQAGLLSGGEQQMLAYGRALMSSPQVVLMDEPSMGLAPALVDQVMDAVAEIAARGIGVLMVEQNAAAALDVATRAAVLDRGRVTTEGTAAHLRSHASVLRAFLGSQSLPAEADAS